MRARKLGGKVFGAYMTAAEKKAMNLEIQRQCAEYDRKHLLEIDAMILWVLHDRFGFGPRRLKRFFDSFASSVDSLAEYYEMDSSDQIWLCSKKLKDIGVDIEKWYAERSG